MSNLFKKFEGLKGAKFIGIQGYCNSHGEVADITLNVNASIENAKQKDLIALKAFKATDLFNLSKEKNIDLETMHTALNELIASAEKNLSADLNERTNQSKAQTDAYVQLTSGLKLHKESLDITVFGFQNQKKVLVEGEYPTVNSRPKTLAKKAIKKACDLRMEKYRSYKLGKADAINITGSTLQIQ